MKKIIGLTLTSLLLFTSVHAQFTDKNQSKEFSIETAQTYQSSLSRTISRIEKKIEKLDHLFPSHDKEYKQYLLSRNDMIDIIDDMKQTVSSINSDLIKIDKYKRDLKKSTEKLYTLKQQTKQTKDSIERVTRLLYQLHNEIYDQGVIDDIKLFTKINNITDAANQEVYMEILLRQLEKLMTNIKADKKTHNKLIGTMYDNKNDLEIHIQSYQRNIENIEKKVAYLESYIELLKNNKEAINAKIADTVKTRTDIEKTIITTMQEIQNRTFLPTWDREAQYTKLLNLPKYGAEDIYTISWPILPIQKIIQYYHDESYQKAYGIKHQGIRLATLQGNAVHAAQDGVIIHVSETNLGIGWISIMHTEGYSTSYLYLSDTFVHEGDIVRKGQVIGYSGGEAGTKGAGFFSQGSNLTFLVTKGDRFIDPLAILDLSVVGDEKMIPDDLTFKYKRDVQRRPIDLTKLSTMEGETERERQIDFLQTYAKGVFQSISLREQAGEGHAIDPSFVICIGFAESTLGHHLTTANNMGNVGNPDDPSVRTNIDAGPLAGIAVIYDTLDNKFLGHYNRIDELSRYRQEDKTSAIYASSTFNRQNNVLNCLTRIKGYHVPEDYAFRTGPRTAVTSSFSTTGTSQRGR